MSVIDMLSHMDAIILNHPPTALSFIPIFSVKIDEILFRFNQSLISIKIF